MLELYYENNEVVLNNLKIIINKINYKIEYNIKSKYIKIIIKLYIRR